MTKDKASSKKAGNKARGRVWAPLASKRSDTNEQPALFGEETIVHPDFDPEETVTRPDPPRSQASSRSTLLDTPVLAPLSVEEGNTRPDAPEAFDPEAFDPEETTLQPNTPGLGARVNTPGPSIRPNVKGLQERVNTPGPSLRPNQPRPGAGPASSASRAKTPAPQTRPKARKHPAGNKLSPPPTEGFNPEETVVLPDEHEAPRGTTPYTPQETAALATDATPYAPQETAPLATDATPYMAQETAPLPKEGAGFDPEETRALSELPKTGFDPEETRALSELPKTGFDPAQTVALSDDGDFDPEETTAHPGTPFPAHKKLSPPRRKSEDEDEGPTRDTFAMDATEDAPTESKKPLFVPVFQREHTNHGSSGAAEIAALLMPKSTRPAPLPIPRDELQDFDLPTVMQANRLLEDDLPTITGMAYPDNATIPSDLDEFDTSTGLEESTRLSPHPPAPPGEELTNPALFSSAEQVHAVPEPVALSLEGSKRSPTPPPLAPFVPPLQDGGGLVKKPSTPFARPVRPAPSGPPTAVLTEEEMRQDDGGPSHRVYMFMAGATMALIVGLISIALYFLLRKG